MTTLVIKDLARNEELATAELQKVVGGYGAGGGSISNWNAFKSLVFGVDAQFYQDESDGKY